MAKAVFHTTILNTATGLPVPNAEVGIIDATSGGYAELWEDRAGTVSVSPNPTTADANGFIEVYVTPGRFRIEADDGNGGTQTWEDELLGIVEDNGIIVGLTNDLIATNAQRLRQAEVDIAGGTDVTLTESDATADLINLTGTLTANVDLIVPDTPRKYTIINSTSGAFTVTVKTAAGTGVVVPQGQARVLRSDGVDVVDVLDGISIDALQVDYSGPVDASNAKDAIDALQAYLGGAVLVDAASATFTNVDNNISATGIGIGVEVGDVIQVSGSASNDTEFTIEVITDNDNVIVNQAHAGGTTSKALTDETATVTIKLLCKWYLAPIGIGQGVVQTSKSGGVTYFAPTNRSIVVFFDTSSAAVDVEIEGVLLVRADASGWGYGSQITVPPGASYLITGGTVKIQELR